MSDTARAAANAIASRNALGVTECAIILDPNFYNVADIVENDARIPYADLPGFPQTASTADGELIIGTVDSIPALILKGRAAFHETGDPSLMASPIETLTHLGVRSILSTTPALSARADLVPGCLVAITDHINFTGLNPLIGAHGDKNAVNMNDAYDKRLLRRIKTAASSAGVSVHEGVLMWFSGPSFETPAEVKAARLLGADLIGWSLAPEAILARRFGLPFAGVGLVTDFGAGFSNGNPTADFGHGPAIAGVVALKRLIRGFVKSR
jgi:purine-nucleoside phosphorylase